MANGNGGQMAPNAAEKVEIPKPHVTFRGFDALKDVKEVPEKFTRVLPNGKEEEATRMVKRTAFYVVGKTSAGDFSGISLDGWEGFATAILNIAAAGPEKAFERALSLHGDLSRAILAVREAKATVSGGKRLEIRSLLAKEA